jgi:uncharacterized membrane protein YdjX (TVP38/TMEM64 family)
VDQNFTLSKHPKLLIGLAVGILATAFIFIIFRADAFRSLTEFLDKEIPALLFVPLMFILPAVGFPISIFLILAGIKFGLTTGLVLMACSFPVHMIVSYLVAHSFFRGRLVSLLNKYGYELPQVRSHWSGWFTIVFMGIPGIPYAPKNYILALAGVPFSQFMGLGLPIHMILGAPFVVLGVSSVQANPLFFIGAIAAVGLGYLLFLKLRSIFFDSHE